jgi:hypothetical protein
MLVYEDLLDWLDANPRIQDLRKKAKELGIRIKKRMKKREIIKVIREDIMRRLEESGKKRSNATSSFGEISQEGRFLRLLPI